MNIFFIDECPITAASYLVDSHLSKMQLESAQIISTIARPYQDVLNARVKELGLEPLHFYKPAYAKHPSTIWAGTNSANLTWLYKHLGGMDLERQCAGHKPHRSWVEVSSRIAPLLIDLLPQSLELSAQPFCGDLEVMPLFKHNKLPKTVELYREYYNAKKSHLHVWKNRVRPDWITANP